MKVINQRIGLFAPKQMWREIHGTYSLPIGLKVAFGDPPLHRSRWQQSSWYLILFAGHVLGMCAHIGRRAVLEGGVPQPKIGYIKKKRWDWSTRHSGTRNQWPGDCFLRTSGFSRYCSCTTCSECRTQVRLLPLGLPPVCKKGDTFPRALREGESAISK